VAIVHLLIEEISKKRMNNSLVSAYQFMISTALESERFATEKEAPGAVGAVAEKVRSAVLEEAINGKVTVKSLMLISQAFAKAKVDIGEPLRQATMTRTENESMPDESDFDFASVEKSLTALATALEDDPFSIQAQISEQVSAFTADQRAAFISALVFVKSQSLREATVGWVLDQDEKVAAEILASLAQAAKKGLVSGATINRFVALRNWVGDALKTSVDEIIRAARQHSPPSPKSAVLQTTDVRASAVDGAGAQSFFAVIRDKRKYMIASLLFKHGFGIRDAWVRQGLSKRDVEDFRSLISTQMETFESSLDTVLMTLRHGLAVNIASGEPIPFGTLQFIECVGIPPVNPEFMETDNLVSMLFNEMEEVDLNETGISASLRRSKHWLAEFDWMDSWFEDGAATMDAVRGQKSIKGRTDAILEIIVAKNRRKWGNLLAWNAYTARDEMDGHDWKDMAIVARELLGNRAITEIPFARLIAVNTELALRSRAREVRC
jgi:hypothetical protein